MFKNLLPFMMVALAACSGGDKGDDSVPGELSGTTGSVTGTLAYGDENIEFAGGIAFGNSFFHDDRDALILTQWGESSCDSTDSFEWETSGEGYKLDIPHDGEDATTEGLLWSCTIDDDYGAGCGGVDYPMIDVVFSTYEPERGGSVKGTLTIGTATDDFVSGTLDFDLVYCGED